jgi:protein TonB
MGPLITGTVVVYIEISKHGEVLHAQAISGPRILIDPVLNAVRQYKYSPFLLNGRPFNVEAFVSVPLTCGK